MLSQVRWEDMDIKYTNASPVLNIIFCLILIIFKQKHNKFAFMGIVRVLAQIEEGGDLVDYYTLDRIDKRWLESRMDL